MQFKIKASPGGALFTCLFRSSGVKRRSTFNSRKRAGGRTKVIKLKLKVIKLYVGDKNSYFTVLPRRAYRVHAPSRLAPLAHPTDLNSN